MTEMRALLVMWSGAFLCGCAGGPAINVRAETGQLGAAEFLRAPWRSENIQNSPPGEVYGFNFIARSADGEILTDLSEKLEAEFGELRRFPVKPLFLAGASADLLGQLQDLGEIELPAGAAGEVKGRFVLEYVCEELHKEYTPSSFAPLQSVSAKIHEYWLEGRASLIPFTASDDGRVTPGEPIWATPSLRSRSSWKCEVTV